MKKISGLLALVAIATLCLVGHSRAELLLSPGDQVIGGVLNATDFVEGTAGTAGGGNNWPAAEPPEELTDGFFGGGNAKYLNFAELNTGVIITPAAGASVVTSMTLWTANDAAERDPSSYELYGTNATITKGGPNTNYAKSDFTLISSGAVVLPAERNTTDTPIGAAPFSAGARVTIPIANSASYTSYMLIFPTVFNEAAANSMQLSEAAFEGQLGLGSPFVITEILYDKAGDMVTITWRSEPGRSYALLYSADLSDWGTDIDDAIEAEDGSDTTSFGPFPNPVPGTKVGYFRVELPG